MTSVSLNSWFAIFVLERAVGLRLKNALSNATGFMSGDNGVVC
ncbi:hypothetical protein N7U66_12530 [Lacinutrix neustonica]|uniref:Uncharacterized protein n=1 Tax=Lacinutrix neustonica TaxID=2980107 RepID=A0A9E8SCT1_9FLAO|nr:hypothetical protein [Lacinutrix neustonica]WAC01007.1 hypothetical protein N7U66_12530 [Lacinutrix neustonica]